MREEAEKGRVSGSVQRVSLQQIITDNLTQLFICQENNTFLRYIIYIAFLLNYVQVKVTFRLKFC